MYFVSQFTGIVTTVGEDGAVSSRSLLNLIHCDRVAIPPLFPPPYYLFLSPTGTCFYHAGIRGTKEASEQMLDD